MKIYILFLALVGNVICGHNKGEWRARTIYQVLTDRFNRGDGNTSPCGNLHDYCGGDYRGLIKGLDYIQEMGFDAIWISPVVDNIDHGYHGYWAKDWTKTNSHFGSEADLHALVSECHKRGMWVMVDVVANHVGPVKYDYGKINPFNKAEHYHDYCIIRDEDFKKDQWRVENCRLADLPDLKQENPWVQDTLLNWLKELMNKFGFDGIRIDTVPEVPKWFWEKFRTAAGGFSLGEVFDDRLDYLKGYIGAIDSVLNYGIFNQLRSTFKGGSFTNLAGHISQLESKFGGELNYMGLFVDNHDNERFLHNHGNWDNLMGALLFSLYFPGIPIVYYGDEQGYGGGADPANREDLWAHMNKNSVIYQFLKKAITVRKQFKIWEQSYKDIWHKDHMLAFTRGTIIVVVTNGNVQTEEDLHNVPFPDGTKFCDALTDYKDCITINKGSVHLSIPGNKSRLFVRR